MELHKTMSSEGVDKVATNNHARTKIHCGENCIKILRNFAGERQICYVCSRIKTNFYMRYPSIRHLVIMIAILFSFAACKNEDVSENAARLQIKLTDAASPVIKELYIDIRQIEVYVTDTTGNEGEWVPLAFPGREYNLLQLMNGKTAQLVDQYFPAGKKIEK